MLSNILEKRLIPVNHSLPKNLQTDAGKEFFCLPFSKLMKNLNINHYHTFTKMKASMAEKVIRTLKELLYYQFSIQGTYKWIDILKKITNQYNDTKHRTIRMKPNEVSKDYKKILLSSVSRGGHQVSGFARRGVNARA